MSQYQGYQNAAHPQDSHYSSNSYQHPQQTYSNSNVNSYPSKSTFPPQSYPSPTMEQPQATYQTQTPMMAEKPQAPTPAAQHAHTKAGYGNQWLFGMFDCSPVSTCCLGYWCPCILFGKTYAREHGEGETSGLGGMCCGWYCAAYFCLNSCLQTMTRSQQRERHGIEGSGFSDFCASFWCPCCTLIQEEKESVVRNTGMDPKTKVAYQPINQSMTYA